MTGRWSTLTSPTARVARVEASVEAVGRVEETTGLRLSESERGSFCAHHAGQRSVKLCCRWSEHQARDLVRLRRAFAEALLLGRILVNEGRAGRGVVEGVPLAEPGSADAAWAGDVLGRIPTTPAPEGVAPRRPATSDAARVEIESLLSQLEAAGALAPPTAKLLRAGITLRTPEQLPLGIAHDDLCPENVVRERTDRASAWARVR